MEQLQKLSCVQQIHNWWLQIAPFMKGTRFWFFNNLPTTTTVIDHKNSRLLKKDSKNVKIISPSSPMKNYHFCCTQDNFWSCSICYCHYINKSWMTLVMVGSITVVVVGRLLKNQNLVPFINGAICNHQLWMK
jgi:hypothetical protein